MSTSIPHPGDMETLEVDRAGWRAWLEAHAADTAEVWLVVPRGGRGITHTEAVEEALCFGWIDSLSRSLSAEARAQRFSPRNPKAAWSTINRAAAERLIAEGRMAPAGLALVEHAEATGTWLLLADAQAGIVPDDLRAALDAVPAAAEHFAAFPPSARRAGLESLALAKRPETRANRIARIVERAARGERP
ncbi:YdeI/OmpD-associated family protein [Pseudonocardia xishanensis]|uniref:YdeI/OmpD-associated family protein n=2 Tax=Pseudonocardia xishanensis TaxID=630995 RepID=A0ABP8RSM3_9PSEU